MHWSFFKIKDDGRACCRLFPVVNAKRHQLRWCARSNWDTVNIKPQDVLQLLVGPVRKLQKAVHPAQCQSLYCIFPIKWYFNRIAVDESDHKPSDKLLKLLESKYRPNTCGSLRWQSVSDWSATCGDGLWLVGLHYVDGSVGKLVLIRALLSSDSMLLGWVLFPPLRFWCPHRTDVLTVCVCHLLPL